MKPKTKLDKFAIAATLQEIAALLELKGGKDRFKARAYQTGARVMAGLSEDLGAVISADRLTSLRGIGDALAAQIKQLYLTGESSVLQDLKKDFPPGIVELSGVPGLSVTKIATLHESLGITSVAELKAAAKAGKIRGLKGFGAKTEEKLIETLTRHNQRQKKEQRLHLHRALAAAEQVSNYLVTAPGKPEIEFAGSLRRWKETVGTIRIVAKTTKPAGLIEYFLRFPSIVQVEEQTKSSCIVRLAEGARASLRAVHPAEFALSWLTETGSQAHLIKLQEIAAGNGKPKAGRGKSSARSRAPVSDPKTEAELYRRWGMQYIPPELREDAGEIEAALAGKLPEDLITVADIEGMVHCHTTYSDGKNSVEEMARRRGDGHEIHHYHRSFTDSFLCGRRDSRSAKATMGRDRHGAGKGEGEDPAWH